MKLEFKNISAIVLLKKLFLQKRAQVTYPYRDWALLLFFFALALTILFGFSVKLFWDIKTGSVFMTPASSAVTGATIDRTVLRELLEFHTMREQDYNKLIDTPPTLRNSAR